MNTVRVDKNELLRKLKSNRDLHIQEFEKATKGFHDRYLDRLAQMEEKASNEGKYELRVNLTEPVNYAASYDLAIAMLEMSQDEVIELSSQDFQRYVMDQWEWADSFKNVVTSYSASR